MSPRSSFFENSALWTFLPEGGAMSGKTVTRADLCEAVYQKVGLSRTESADLVEQVLSEISDCLVSGEAVKLSSFGSFLVRSKGERIGRNPKTGEEVADLAAARDGVPAFQRAEAEDQRVSRRRLTFCTARMKASRRDGCRDLSAWGSFSRHGAGFGRVTRIIRRRTGQLRPGDALSRLVDIGKHGPDAPVSGSRFSGSRFSLEARFLWKS